MSLTKSALSYHQQQQRQASSIPSSGANSEADTDAETMSNAPSSASGHSIEIGGTDAATRQLRGMRELGARKERAAQMSTAIATAVARHQREDPLDGARTNCSMCSINPSEYLCAHCGRLSFCTKCCLNLHDNKYLCGHEFQILDSIPEGERCGLEDIKRKKNAREEEERAGRKLLQASTILRPNTEGAPLLPIGANKSLSAANKSITAALAQPSSHANIDMASLTADRSVITVRLRELSTCLESGQQLHRELAAERNTAKETAATAVEAVRRRFDVLRQLINAKEAEFVAVVEEAGRERFDLATAATCSINIAASELEGFISHTANQMDRLADNTVQFNAQRQGLLDSTYNTLTAVDGWTHDHQTRLQEIRSMSLGVHVPIDVAADAIQSIHPPKFLSHRGTEEGRNGILSIREAAAVPVGEILSPMRQQTQTGPVPAAKFVDAPGVKVVVQTTVNRRAAPNAGNTTVLSLAGSRVQSPLRSGGNADAGRKLHTVEQQELRSTPMREVVRPQWKEEQRNAGGLHSTAVAGTAARKTASPLRASSVATQNANMSLANVSVIHHNASIHIPTASGSGLNSSRAGTPTRRVMYGRVDSGNSVPQNGSGGVNVSVASRPTVPSAAVGRSGSALSSSGRYAVDPYSQRMVSAAIKNHAARALSPGGTSQRFTTSPHSRATSPIRGGGGGTSSFALPTNAVRRGGSPMRGSAAASTSSVMNASVGGINRSGAAHRGSSDNPGPGAYGAPMSSFAPRKTTSPMRR